MADAGAAPIPARETWTVAVGSTNGVKVEACRRAFTRAFRVPSADAPVAAPADTHSHTHGVEDTPAITFHGFSAASGVSDQPMGDDETRRGAFNRALNAAKAFADAHGHAPTFAVGLEGGCAEDAVTLPSIGGEPRTELQLTCFAWMAVLHVPTGRWGVGRTSAFTLPPAVATLVRAGVELGHADDQVFGRTNSKQKDGAVGLLTKGLITRAEYYEHALIVALIPHTASEYYPLE